MYKKLGGQNFMRNKINFPEKYPGNSQSRFSFPLFVSKYCDVNKPRRAVEQAVPPPLALLTLGGQLLAILGFLLYNLCYFVFLIIATHVYS